MTYNLDFISDDDLYQHTKNTILKYRFDIDFKKLNANLLDPIKLTFDSAVYHGNYDNLTLEQILEDEVRRQMDKSNTNHIGYFHQNIFNLIGKENGWSVPKSGFDIVNDEQKIYVEMKNKHNTMNSASSAKTYLRMQNKLLNEPGATCLLVEVIAKKSQNNVWTCTVDKQKLSHDNIRRVSIDKFYEMVTDNKNAFAELCQVLPKVISDVLKNEQEKIIQNTVIDDIKKEKIEHILTALYVMSFKTYQGFDDFKLMVK
ncbi:Eco47II family restriction endonuclease [Ursidibacter arcticus]